MNETSHIPTISVLLPVYNAQNTLREAIDSILNQSFNDFELIVLNDGSTDDSEAIIKSYSDPRIRYLAHPNCGLAATLNKGLQIAKAEIIARQDNDDCSKPTRFEKQLRYLQDHQACVLLGTAAEIIDEKGTSTGRIHAHPSDNCALQFQLLFDNPFVHSSVMFRKSLVIELGGYSTANTVFEDYDLWSKLAAKGELANLPDVLLSYRESTAGMSRSTSDYRKRVQQTSYENLRRLNCFDDATLKLNVYGAPTQARYKHFLNAFQAKFEAEKKCNPLVIGAVVKQHFGMHFRVLYNELLSDQTISWFQKIRLRFLRYLLFKTYFRQ